MSILKNPKRLNALLNLASRLNCMQYYVNTAQKPTVSSNDQFKYLNNRHRHQQQHECKQIDISKKEKEESKLNYSILIESKLSDMKSESNPIMKPKKKLNPALELMKLRAKAKVRYLSD